MIKVVFYAQLKDFFGDETEIELPANPVAAGIRSALTSKNALAAEWLKVSRLASEDAFISEEEKLTDGGRYYLLPPSSGG
jgi:molybdopterin synthase sulfur carrier subunit